MSRLTNRVLYLCTPDRPDLERFIAACVRGGVDVVQLRDKQLDPRSLVERGRVAFRVCQDLGVPFLLNDRPDLALEIGADGVHVGQRDAPPGLARRILGPSAIIGLSTRGGAQLSKAADQPVDYVSVGPVMRTDTHPTRDPVRLSVVADAAARVATPIFVTGNVRPDTVAPMAEAGARRFVVVRWLTEAADPTSSPGDFATQFISRSSERAEPYQTGAPGRVRSLASARTRSPLSHPVFQELAGLAPRSGVPSVAHAFRGHARCAILRPVCDSSSVPEACWSPSIAWSPGDVVVQENYYAGHLITAFPVVVAEDCEGYLSLYTRAGSTRVDGTMPRRPSIPLDERMRVYELTEPQPLEERPVRFHVLTLNPHATHHSFWAFWWPDWRFFGWYINLQSPYERTPVGIAIGRGCRGDYYLDLKVEPDLTWAWKDRDEFEAACNLGLLTKAERATALAEAERMIERVERRAWPFNEAWQDWRPPQEWPRPNLLIDGERRWRIENAA
ncbi:MAG TPA: thiamine phosphate synthase [Acidimicrobiales bacterium]|nr:thiamine phosphate synthase [Acidimicrobiales bacterium]